MQEWICNFEDAAALTELRSVLAKAHYFLSQQTSRGARIRFLVGYTGSPNLKVEVFANEHPPPHFRVRYGGETANYRISDCEQLNGGLHKYERFIRQWHAKNKHSLIEQWNKARPSDCPVGRYIES
jgi:hypothetical protein